MKRFVNSVILATAFSWAVPAAAYMIGSSDVGGADTLVGQTNNLNTNPTGTCGTGNSVSTELCWINNLLASLGKGSTTYQEADKVDPQSYSFVDGSSSVIAFALAKPTGYFFIKNARWYGLFANNDALGWAVIDTSQIAGGFNLPSDDLEISHIAPVGGTVSVPEPGTLALLGLGLLAIGCRHRRVKL